MFQPDLFAQDGNGKATTRRSRPAVPVMAASSAVPSHLDLPTLLERLADKSKRPRYTFMVLNLIARAAGNSDSAGPYVRQGGRALPIRDWLSDALVPVAQRDARRLAVIDEVRTQLEDSGLLPDDPQLAQDMIAADVRDRLRRSGRTNVSRAVSDLVGAGLLQRHYQGYRVDHCNRGAQREAVYTIPRDVRHALAGRD